MSQVFRVLESMNTEIPSYNGTFAAAKADPASKVEPLPEMNEEQPFKPEVAASAPEVASPPDTADLVPEEPDEEWIPLEDVEVEEIDWLWPSRIALGKLTILAGDPGLGKSTLSLDIASRVTCGRAWPDDPSGENPVGSVLLLCCEDGLADTIKPRLIAAGAEFGDRRVQALKSARKPDGELGPFSLRTDIPRLEAKLIKQKDVRLIIIDPVSCYMGETDDNKNGAVRSVLTPLADMAARHRVAVLLITHLNKAAGGKSAYRLMGSLAFGAAARAVWLIASDPQDDGRVLMLQSKNNLAPRTSALAYRIKEGVVEWDDDPIDMTADDLLNVEADKSGPPRALDRAATFLRELLASAPLPATAAVEKAEQAGISERTLIRAKKVAGVISKLMPKDDGSGNEWVWSIDSCDSDPD